MWNGMDLSAGANGPGRGSSANAGCCVRQRIGRPQGRREGGGCVVEVRWFMRVGEVEASGPLHPLFTAAAGWTGRQTTVQKEGRGGGEDGRVWREPQGRLYAEREQEGGQAR